MTTTSPAPARRGSALAWLLLLLLLPLAAWLGWRGWQVLQQRQARAVAEQAQHIAALQSRIDGLRRGQRAHALRLQQADATNRVLRDELLGLGQRAALLEDSIDRLADPGRNGAQALRVDEVELLLAQAGQRLLLAGDLDGARRAYALAADILDGVADPALLDLRQVLIQERAALDALGDDPRARAAARLAAFVASLDALPAAAPAGDAAGPWWRRALARVVDVQPSASGARVPLARDRAAARVALQLELTLARASLERRDHEGWRGALARIDGWLLQLWPPSPARARARARVRALQALPLALELPTLGSTLEQLRARRTGR